METNKLRRLISFLVLLAIIVLIGVLFYRVMASFVLPLFLAAVLVVIFSPMHRRILKRFNGRTNLAAAMTTSIVGVVVLLPIIIAGTYATVEGSRVLKNITPGYLAESIGDFRKVFRLEIPNEEAIRSTQSLIEELVDDTVLKEDTNAISGILRRLNEQKTKIKVAEQKDSVQRSFSNYCDVLKNLTDTSIELDISEILDGGIKLREAFALFRTDYLGGTLKEALIDTANPSPRELTEISDNLLNSESRKRILQAGANTVGYFISLLAGIVIMLIAVFFFLVDGRGMIQTILKLSPLKSDYEKMLIDEFVSISRAVVLATVLSALAQGVLAGIGFWIAGLNSILLLTFAATLLAMVPFVGAAVVWFPAAIWLILFADKTGYGIFLLIWGVGPVSLSDNIIKPMVLQNTSKLHPMFALLSVVGGVQALGPIGILTGPMVVVFLQTLLNILHRELSTIDGEELDNLLDNSPLDASPILLETQPDTAE
ncbi:MAG: AI-2E family transporter [Pirellulales bacterium]|nr:AI-2E family transporter [Pirellulales bacterium]